MAFDISQLLSLLQQQPQQGAPPQPGQKVKNPFLGVHGDQVPSPTMQPMQEPAMPQAPQGAVVPQRDPLDGNPFMPFGRGGKPQPKENLGSQVMSGAGDLLSSLKIPGAFEQQKGPAKAAPAVMSSPAPAAGGEASPSNLFQRLDAERGYSAQDKAMMGAQGTGPIASMFTDAASEVMQRGADTPDKADNLLRSEFQDDPEIESAIAAARERYNTAHTRSQTGPGVMEYVGYVLATLAGANPMQAAEAISRRGEKRQDEQMALQDLLGAQGMKIKDRQMQRELGVGQQNAADKLLFQQQKETQRQSERGEDQNFQRLKAGRGADLQRMNQLQQAVQYATNPAEKKALQAELDQLKRRTQFFGRQLGEPEQDEQGRPMGVASPDAMRLLGLG